MKAPRLPSGIEDFNKMRTWSADGQPLVIADKTRFLPALIESGNEVSVFTRPIRFMKSSTLSMMARFLSIHEADTNRRLFEGLAVSGDAYADFRAQYQGQVPVIFFTLKNIQADNWDEAKEAFGDVMANLYRKHQYVLDSLDEGQKAKYLRVINQQASHRELKSSLADLAMYLSVHHGNKKVVILIDEYDTPLHQAYQNTEKAERDVRNGYFQQMTQFLNSFLSQALKSHPHVEKGYMTGVLRTAFASLVSSLNNAAVYSVLSPEFAEVFGFTEEDVDGFIAQIEEIEEADRDRLRGRLQRWYNGYSLGESTVRMYNPWSIAQFFNSLSSSNRLAARAYWLQAGNSLALEEHLAPRFLRLQSHLTQLILGKTITVTVDERTTLTDLDNPYDDSGFWGLLLHAGYLSASKVEQGQDTLFQCDVIIPNYEVAGAYARLINRCQATQLMDIDPGLTTYTAMLKALREGNIDDFATYLQAYMEQAVSFHDIPKRPHKRRRKKEPGLEVAEDITAKEEYQSTEKTREQVYHAFMLGLLAGLHSQYFQLSSNREAGYGRYDIVLMPSDMNSHGLIFEFKAADTPDKLEQEATAALQQIEDKSYQAILEGRGVAVGLHIGIAFCGKRFHIVHQRVDYQPAAAFRLPESPYSGSHSPEHPSSTPDKLPSPSLGASQLGTSQASFFKPAPAQYFEATLAGDGITFEAHGTSGQGNSCGYYALPIPYDRAGAKQLLLDAQHDHAVRALVVPEIRDAVLAQQLPTTFPRREWYVQWRLEYINLSADIDTVNRDAVNWLETNGHTLPAERTPENILPRLAGLTPAPAQYEQLRQAMETLASHETTLQVDTNTIATYVNFIEHDVDSGGQLGFYANINQTSIIDALAQLAHLRVHIWQTDPQDAGRVRLVREAGPVDGTVTHLHHAPGLSTHFQLMSVRPGPPQSQPSPSLLTLHPSPGGSDHYS